MRSNTVVLAAVLLPAVLAGACEKSFSLSTPTEPTDPKPAPDAIAINGTYWMGPATVTDCQHDMPPLLVSEVAQQCNLRSADLGLFFRAPDDPRSDLLRLEIQEGGANPFSFIRSGALRLTKMATLPSPQYTPSETNFAAESAK